jgi:glycosyltransferase involved in cell wall biosynthesis
MKDAVFSESNESLSQPSLSDLSDKSDIKVSVVVPTFNRPTLLRVCLGALQRQDLGSHAYEIVVVDDGHSQEIAQFVLRSASTSSVLIKYVTTGRTNGPAAARNAGFRVAVGDIIAFTDDDCIPEPNWLREGLSTFTTGISAVTGRLLMPLPERPTDYQRDAARLAQAVFVTANCFIRRDVFAELEGFDERFTIAWREDSDLHFRLLERNALIINAAAAVVVHPLRPAPWAVSVRQQKKALFNALLYKKHPDLYRQHIQRWPPLRYYASMFALGIFILGLSLEVYLLGLLGAGAWFFITIQFCMSRLRDNSRSFRHVLEMIITSAVIPPLAVFWRLVGAIRFHVLIL